MQKKVLLASEYFHPHWTGIAKTFYYVGQNLIKQGYDVTVLTTQFDSASPRNEDLDGIHIIRSPYQFKLSRTHYSFSILATFLSIISRYETVIINSPNSNILFFTILTKLFGKKCIIYHQGDLTLPKKTGNQLTNRFLELIFDILSIPSFMLADIISTYTEDYARHSRVMKRSIRKFRAYIPHYTLSINKPSQEFSEKMATLKKNHILVGFAGRFVEEKAYDILLQAIPLVTQKIPDAHFVFAGKTKMDYEPFYEYVEPLIEPLIKKNHPSISFLGLLEDGDYRLFFESLTTFVISSRSDCFPTTQIEAVLQGIPTVCTDIPGARMLVKETGFGEIVKTEDPESLAHGIITVIENRARTIADIKTRDIYESKHKNVINFLKKYENFPTHL